MLYGREEVYDLWVAIYFPTFNFSSLSFFYKKIGLKAGLGIDSSEARFVTKAVRLSPLL